jgi:hypothetical protein
VVPLSLDQDWKLIVVSPAEGPEWGARFTATLLFPE